MTSDTVWSSLGGSSTSSAIILGLAVVVLVLTMALVLMFRRSKERDLARRILRLENNRHSMELPSTFACPPLTMLKLTVRYQYVRAQTSNSIRAPGPDDCTMHIRISRKVKIHWPRSAPPRPGRQCTCISRTFLWRI